MNFIGARVEVEGGEHRGEGRQLKRPSSESCLIPELGIPNLPLVSLMNDY